MPADQGPNKKVELTTADNIAELRLNDPDRRNAFSPSLGEDLLTLMLSIDEMEDISAVVLTADGPAFCAGLDLSILRGDDPESREYMFNLLGGVIDWLYWSDRPVIVGANGPAPGGGSIIINATDVRIAGEDLSMWWPEVAFGLAGQHIAARLVSQVGWPKAVELMLLGNEYPLEAEEAKQIGLVNRVVEPEMVDETARDVAAIIAEHDRQHNNIQSHLQAMQYAREELQGASQAYSGWLSRNLSSVLDN